MKTKPDTINGTKGDDFYQFVNNDSTPMHISALAGNDVIWDSSPYDVVSGGDGNDQIDCCYLGFGMYQTLDGGAGNDQIKSWMTDTVIGGAGADTIWYSGDNNTGIGSVSADSQDWLRLWGTGGDARISGCTTNTRFDFSHIGDRVDQPGTNAWAVYRGDLTFDTAGNLHIDHVGQDGVAEPTVWHGTIHGTPFHNDAQLDAAIASGKVTLTQTVPSGTFGWF